MLADVKAFPSKKQDTFLKQNKRKKEMFSLIFCKNSYIIFLFIKQFDPSYQQMHNTCFEFPLNHLLNNITLCLFLYKVLFLLLI